jgi:soluble lytic murein transglycosylase-like protein
MVRLNFLRSISEFSEIQTRVGAADGTVRMRWMLLVSIAAVAAAQTPQQRARATIEASIARQRASVARQVQAMRPAPAAAPVPRPACAPLAPAELDVLIGEASHEHGVEVDLVREVARQESAFRPCAVSPKGAQGLMQLMPATQADLAVRDPFDPRESLMAGTRLLRQLLDRYHGDLALALSAYNAGPARVDRTMSVPEILETQNYVAGILDRLGR